MILAVAYTYEKTVIWHVTEQQIARIAQILLANPDAWSQCQPILGDSLCATNAYDDGVAADAIHYEENNDYYLSLTEGPDGVLECLGDWGYEDMQGTDLPEGSAAQRFGELLD